MGSVYYGVCNDCKAYIDLDKFWSWSTYDEADHATIDKTDLEEYKETSWIYRALRLHIFIKKHNGHRLGVYTEYEVEERLSEMKEEFRWPEPFKKLTEEIDMYPAVGRLVINTGHGQLFIDSRGDDVNCFRFVDGKRVDTVLLEKKE